MRASAERLMGLLREIVECCQEGEQIQSQAHDLTPAEARALTAIRFHECKTTADLADALFVGKSRVTRILDGMVKKNLVKRTEQEDDRRKCSVRLTAKGTEVTDHLIDFILKLHSDVLSSLPKGAASDTLATLTTVKEAMHSTRAKLRAGEFQTRVHHGKRR